MRFQHRNQVLRAFFGGKNWDENAEFRLKRELVMNTPPALAEYPFLIEDEWEVQPGHTNHGRGDLVFFDGHRRYAVVEVKHFDPADSGRGAGKKRRSKRALVEDQAWRYASAYCGRLIEVRYAVVAAFSATPSGITLHAVFDVWSGRATRRTGVADGPSGLGAPLRVAG